ncbi:MAG: HD domain-containing protein [Anaerotignaceae bacterium]
MADLVGKAICKMIEYNNPDIRRIDHALKVLGYANAIGFSENLTEKDKKLLLISSIFHDIGIHKAEEIYNSSAGNYQQELGPDVARPMLEELNLSPEEIEVVCFNIAHHHTYNLKDNKLLQILIEADFIVNIEEDNHTDYNRVAQTVKDKIFITDSGKRLMDSLFQTI